MVGVLKLYLVANTWIMNPALCEIYRTIPRDFRNSTRDFKFKHLHILLNRVLMSDHAQHGAVKCRLYLVYATVLVGITSRVESGFIRSCLLIKGLGLKFDFGY